MQPRTASPRTSLIAISVLLLTACAGPSDSQQVDPSVSASEAPTMPSLTFAFTSDTPVATRKLAGHDESWMNPGAIIERDDELHMFANVFSQWPGQVTFPHLVSTDGQTWTRADSSPAFSSGDIPFVDNGADVSGGATAPGPDGPWTIDPEPILTPGPSGSFDAGGLQWPSVVHTDDGYLMY